MISGVYQQEVGMSDSVERIKKLVAAFEENEGRRPRILVAKIGQDGHDRGQKVIASASPISASTSTSGRCSPPRRKPRARRSRTTSTSSASPRSPPAHLTLVPQLKADLEAQGRGDIMIVVGGVMPPQDCEALRQAGAEAIFPPGTVITEAAQALLARLNQRLGHVRNAAE